ncbi:MAG: glycosyltransferase family 4 protein [Anaerolineales bacterium]|nr:glycosyltransferase family 4 protein [Anaerolineales bacterium]MDW8160748.1 glycosyltransferase family 4 protein [Anaerolineales bacterium]
MKILLIHQVFAALDEPGGTRHYELAHFFAACGHCVEIVTSPINYMTGSGSGAQKVRVTQVGEGEMVIWRVPVYCAFHRSFVHRTLSFLSFMITAFWKSLNVKEISVVWGTSPPLFQGLTAWCVARLKRKPFLFEVRDLWPAFAVQVGVLKNPLLIAASEWLERFLLRRADLVVVNSPGFVEHVQKRGAKRVEVIPNGSDLELFAQGEDGSEFRRRHGLEGKFVVLYAGAHGLSNDLDQVLKAAEYLRTHSEIVFVLVGDGKEKLRLLEEASRKGLSNVRFLPPVPKNEMAGILRGADVCLAILKPIPLYGTVFPNKVFDYMAAGKAVLLAIPGVIRRVVEEHRAGLAVPPGDPRALAEAVLYLAQNRELVREMGRNGQRAIQTQFDRKKLAEAFLGLFVELAQRDSS